MMPKAAGRKHKLIYRSAGMPISYISWLFCELKTAISSRGNSWNATRPIAMIIQAIISPFL